MTTFVGAQTITRPFSSVVYLEVTYASGNVYTGSGVMIGANDVLTAGHMVYSDTEGLAVSVQVSAAYNNGAEPFGSVTAARINYFDYDTDGNNLLTRAESQNDLALVSLPTALGNQTGWMTMTPGQTTGNYNLTGYPGYYAGPNGAQQTNDYGHVTEDAYNWVFNYNSIESHPGNSGGPLWFQGANGPMVVGIASTGGWAADVTLHYDQLAQWAIQNNDLIGTSEYILQIGRLYEAGLNRSLDVAGFNYWIDAYEAGQSLVQIAGTFLDSAEFTSRYGDDDTMSNTTFLNTMYNNALGRTADAAGLAYWQDQMAHGMSRETVLIQFSESTENVAQSSYLSSVHEASLGYWTV